MSIKVNTELVITTAKDIDRINNFLKEEFASPETSINNLDNTWNGQAANVVKQKFRKIKQDFYENRYNVIKNMTNFMTSQVAGGYEKTEAERVSAASAFK